MFLIGPDRPLIVIQIQFRCDADQSQVRRPEGIHRSHIAPITLLAGLYITERIGIYPVFVDHRGYDVLTKVMLGVRCIGILDELLIKKLGIEDIDAHRGQRHLRVIGQRLRVCGFFGEFIDTSMVIH